MISTCANPDPNPDQGISSPTRKKAPYQKKGLGVNWSRAASQVSVPRSRLTDGQRDMEPRTIRLLK